MAESEAKPPPTDGQSEGKSGYSTFRNANSAEKERMVTAVWNRAKKGGHTFISPGKFSPPVFASFVAKHPGTFTHEKLKWFTVVYLALVYVAYHMSRLPFSIAKTVLHPNCSALDAALTVSDIRVDDTCGWAPFDKPNYTLLFGVLDYVFTFTYSIALLFISGPLAERVRPRAFLTFGVFLCATSVSLFGLGYHLQMHSLWYYVMCMILLGIAQSTGLPVIVSVLTKWTTEEGRGKTIGLWSASMFVGNILGAVIPGQFVSVNWPMAFYVPGVTMIVLALITPLVVLAEPKEVGFTRDGQIFKLASQGSTESTNEEAPLVGEEDENSEMDDDREAISYKKAFMIPGVLEFAFCLFFVKLVCYTALYWLPKMMSMKGFSPEHASYLTATFDAGGMFGALFSGLISDRVKYAALIVVTSLTLGMPPLLGLNYLDGYSSVASYIVLLLISGILVNGPYAYIVSVVSSKKGEEKEKETKNKVTGTVSGIIDGIGSFGGSVGPLLAGYVAGINYDYIVNIFIVALILSVLMLSRQAFFDASDLLKREKSDGDDATSE